VKTIARTTVLEGEIMTRKRKCHTHTHTDTHTRTHARTHAHTHTRLTALFTGLIGSACIRKVKPIWILLKQETVSSSGISWAVCKSTPRSRQITMPAPHHSSFLQAGCPSCCPTNSVKALKATKANVNQSNSFVAAAEQVCLQPVLEHWQQRG